MLEGAEGFLDAYTDDADTAPLLENLGTRYRLLESGFKPHAACRYAHGPIDAAISLMREHRFAAGAIERIDVHLSELAHRQSSFHEPKSVASAVGPLIAGWLFSLSIFGWPLVLAGTLKGTYDLLLFWRFRTLKPPEEQQVAGGTR